MANHLAFAAVSAQCGRKRSVAGVFQSRSFVLLTDLVVRWGVSAAIETGAVVGPAIPPGAHHALDSTAVRASRAMSSLPPPQPDCREECHA